MNNKKTLWITTTAIFIAMLIGVQVVTAPFSQFVTGPLVNLILIISVMTLGLASGMAVAVVSPVVAGFIGVGPVWAVVPFIILGNATLVIIWYLICKMRFARTFAVRVTALAVAAICKFLVLYFGVVQIAIPYILHLPEQQAERMSALFSLSQLLTALIGGAVAIVILPVIEKARASKTL